MNKYSQSATGMQVRKCDKQLNCKVMECSVRMQTESARNSPLKQTKRLHLNNVFSLFANIQISVFLKFKYINKVRNEQKIKYRC